ncbi:MAG TPA: DNA-3-methyladenine glycosylase [Candidatus Saccharimonadales bacterium]
MDAALTHLQENDPALARLIQQYPAPSFEKHTNYYHELVDSIISQQLSVKAARTIEGRFKDLFGGNFPSPEQILTKDAEELRAVGLSRPKANYIQDLARKILDGTIRFDTIDSLSNDEIIEELTKVKGIGVWTVHMFLMFCMGRLDVLPTGDLGIKNGVGKLYGFQSVPTPEEVTIVASRNNWHPYESVASWYIWQCLDNTPKN